MTTFFVHALEIQIYLKNKLSISALRLKECNQRITALKKELDNKKLEELRRRQAEREKDERLKELEKRVAVLSVNEDRLKIEQKAEVDNLLGQISTLIEKCENIVDDVVTQTKASLMQEFKTARPTAGTSMQ
ncbi:hypothetical protein ACOSP7_013334 [Xanthoceras sorbifolium]